jgi:hypothetical protein
MRRRTWTVALIGIFGSLLVTFGIGLAETVTVPPCGNTPGTTTGAYSGLVSMQVSGLLVNTPGNPLQDAFYGVDPTDTSMSVGPCQGCFRFNRVSEGSCLCSFECAATSHPIESILAQPLPAFESSHIYTVLLDLGGGPAEQLHFAMADCGCSDNSGEYTVIIEPATTTTTTSTTTTTIPPDADGDGVLDANESCICLRTPPGLPVTIRGCSVDQACPCAAPLGRAKWLGHTEYVMCVKNVTEELKLAGVITWAQRNATILAAANGTCGQ